MPFEKIQSLLCKLIWVDISHHHSPQTFPISVTLLFISQLIIIVRLLKKINFIIIITIPRTIYIVIMIF